MQTRNNKKRENSDNTELNDRAKKVFKKDNIDDNKTTITKTIKETKTYDNIKWNEINIDELGGLLLKDLKVIGKSIGISINGASRRTLINKINFIIKFNIESIEKQKLDKIKETNNPFNKTTFDQLIITPDKQGQDELLFWKIFKNKSIYKKVMSFMKVLPNSIGYDYIIDVNEMMENGQIGLLKEKVKRTQYLVFCKNYYNNREITPFIKLFSLIKDDKSFYYSLFTNYKDQLPDKIGNCLIKANCLIGFQVLVSELNYYLYADYLKFAIENCRWEHVKFLVDIYNNKPTNSLSSINAFPKYNPEIKSSENIVLFNEFFNSYKQYSNSNSSKIIDGWFKYEFIKPLNIRLKDLVKWIDLYELFDPQWSTFEKSSFKYPNYCNGKFQNQLLETPTETIKNEIKLFKFSKLQLKSNVNDPINYSSKERFNIIKLLHVMFKVIFKTQVAGSNCLADYFNCYNYDDDDIIVEKDNVVNNGYQYKLREYFNYDDIHFLKSALEHGNYSKLIKCFNDKRFIIQDGSSSIYQHYHSGTTEDLIANLYDNGVDLFSKPIYQEINILFSKCQDKESQIKFINLAIQDIKSNNGKQNILKPMHLFLMLVNFDDLELVKLFVNQLGREHIHITRTDPGYRAYCCCFSNSITRYINSIKMLDYIFSEFYQLLTQDDLYGTINNDNLIRCQFSNINLLKHIELLNNEKGGIEAAKKSLWVNVIQTTVELVAHVLNNSDNFGRINELISIKPIDFNDNQDYFFSILKNSIETTTDILFEPLSFFKDSLYIIYPPKSFIKYLIWLSEYPSKEIKFPKQSTLKLVQYFITMEEDYEQLFEDVTYTDIIDNFGEIVRFSIIRGDLKTLSRVLDCLLNALDIFILSKATATKIEKTDNIKQQDKIKFFILHRILDTIVFEEQYIILEYLHSNYNRLLKKKQPASKSKKVLTPTQEPIFNNAEFCRLINNSSKNNKKISQLIQSITNQSL